MDETLDLLSVSHHKSDQINVYHFLNLNSATNSVIFMCFLEHIVVIMCVKIEISIRNDHVSGNNISVVGIFVKSNRTEVIKFEPIALSFIGAFKKSNGM